MAAAVNKFPETTLKPEQMAGRPSQFATMQVCQALSKSARALGPCSLPYFRYWCTSDLLLFMRTKRITLYIFASVCYVSVSTCTLSVLEQLIASGQWQFLCQGLEDHGNKSPPGIHDCIQCILSSAHMASACILGSSQHSLGPHNLYFKFVHIDQAKALPHFLSLILHICCLRAGPV